jgi:hypothetical protein
MLTLRRGALGDPGAVRGRSRRIGFVNTINSGELARDGRADDLGSPSPGPRSTRPRSLVRHPAADRHLRRHRAGLVRATRGRERFAASDIVLALCGIVVGDLPRGDLRHGGAELRRHALRAHRGGLRGHGRLRADPGTDAARGGLALVIITGVFLVYTFTAHLLPGILAVQNAYTWQRFFGHVYSDAGILGPTTAVSSTYIILFIIFAAFLQASKVGDYFVNFAFAAAGRARGGPAKVAIFASGLMGMINGTRRATWWPRARSPSR